MYLSIGFCRLVAVLAFSLGIFAASNAFADSHDGLKLKRSFGVRDSGESHVQMRSLLAPVRRSAKSRSTVNIPVTPVLTVVSKDLVGHVCRLGPRITDALLRSWHARPMSVSDMFDPTKGGERVYRISKTDRQKALDARLIAEINKALEQALVSDILVIKGVQQMGGGGISKLPFASLLGCAELEESEPEPKEGEEKPK